MTTDEVVLTLDEQLAVARTVSKSIARSFPPVDADDIQQELSLWIWSHQDRANRLNGALLHSKLKQEGTSYARKERAVLLHLSDYYFYLPAVVRESLYYFFDKTCWADYRADDDEPVFYAKRITAEGKASADPADPSQSAHEDALAHFSDMSEAWDQLPQIHQMALWGAYGTVDGRTDSSSSERSKTTRAVDALTGLMNNNLRLAARSA